MEARFVRVGNSQALMIPAAIMREHGWQIGDVVDVQNLASGIAVVEHTKRAPLREMARRFVMDNLDLIERLAKL